MLTENRLESGVSAVIGEMLMIAIVLILVAVFSSSISQYLPSERSPTVTIMMSNDTSTITLWHKGGDWVKTDSLKVIITSKDNQMRSYRLTDPEISVVPEGPPQSFDLNSSIKITPSDLDIGKIAAVTLVTDRAVIFSGSLMEESP